MWESFKVLYLNKNIKNKFQLHILVTDCQFVYVNMTLIKDICLVLQSISKDETYLFS